MISRIACFSIVAALLLGCGKAQQKTLGIDPGATGFAIRSQCPVATAPDYYYSVASTQPNDQSLTAFWSDVYSRALGRLDLPSLSCGQRPNTYRFTWVRSFHEPVSVSIVQSDEKVAMVYATEFDGEAPATQTKSSERAMTTEEVVTFNKLLQKSRFWVLPQFPNEPPGTDGSSWIIEGREGSRYQMAARWSPERGERVHNLGIHFLSLLDRKYEDLY